MDNKDINYFANTDHRNKNVRFGIKAEDRTRHVYVIGKTGMGKSTMLENMAVQDIQNGNGLTFMDPHGSTAEKLLEYIPEERVDDVLYFAPFDVEYPVAFNVMEDVGEDKRHLVLDGLMSAFKKIWVDAFSARMEYILGNTILALLEYPDSTMLDINRMYSDDKFRKKVVDYVKDPQVKDYWQKEYAGYTDRYVQEATPAIQNKVGQFTTNPLIRNIVGQSKSTFDVRDMMDNKKIIIINLSKGRVGERNADLLGSMLITKIYLAAMSRADLSSERMAQLPNFYMFVDEFQSFANESFANILSEARKYKLNLTIAHQYMEQMSEEVRAAVIGNVGTMISFRVGSFDAEVLEKEFAPQFTSEDIVNLGFAQIYLKLMVNGISSSPFSATTLPPIEKPRISYKDVAIARSRKNFASLRAEVEAKLRAEEPQVEEKPKSAQRTDSKSSYKKQSQTSSPKSAISQGSSKNSSHNKSKNSPKSSETEVGSDEHRQSLREALKGLVSKDSSKSEDKNKKNVQDKKSPADKNQNNNTNSSKNTKESESQTEKKEETSDKSKKPSEIPESELKKILQVDK